MICRQSIKRTRQGVKDLYPGKLRSKGVQVFAERETEEVVRGDEVGQVPPQVAGCRL